MPDAMVDEWLALLGITTEYMTAAEGLIDALQGKLGVETFEDGAREKAAAEIKRRVDAYTTARRNLVKYAKERQQVLSG